MKKGILIVIGIIIILWIIGKSKKETSGIIKDEQTYNNPWREPANEEFVSIGKLMVKNGVEGCGEYQLKEVSNGEYIIACTSDGENWIYYIAWPNVDKIYRTNTEMDSKLSPPR